MDLKQYYEEISLRIKDIDFFLLWPGFKKNTTLHYMIMTGIFNHQEIKRQINFR